MTKRGLRARGRRFVDPSPGGLGTVSAEATGNANGNIPGHAPILEVVGLQSDAPDRSALARFFGASPLTEDSRPWFDAAVSDTEVGGALARMGREWTVFHSLPIAAGVPNIGHLIVGPGGVFIVGTRSHAGKVVRVSQRTFLIAGVRHPYIREMEFEMGLVERLLGDASGLAVEVSGVIAVVAARSITVEEQHRDVAVVGASEIAAWLAARPRSLSEDEIRLIVRAAGQDTTWFTADTQATEPQRLHADFSAVRREVTRAWRVQMSWTVVILLLGGGGVGYLTYSIFSSTVTGLGSP